MTVVNASISYCYSILLTVLCCHSLPALFVSQPHPTPLIHSLTRKTIHKNIISGVRIHCPCVFMFHSLLVGASYCPESSKIHSTCWTRVDKCGLLNGHYFCSMSQWCILYGQWVLALCRHTHTCQSLVWAYSNIGAVRHFYHKKLIHL